MLLTPHSGHFSPFISCSCKLTAPLLVYGTRQCGLIGPIPQLFPVCPGALALPLKLVLFSRASSCPSFGELWSYFCAVCSRDICQASLGTTLPSTEGDSLEPHLATVDLSRVPCLEQSRSVRILHWGLGPETWMRENRVVPTSSWRTRSRGLRRLRMQGCFFIPHLALHDNSWLCSVFYSPC